MKNQSTVAKRPRFSLQRQAILDLLSQSQTNPVTKQTNLKSHLTADQIYQSLKKSMPRLSKGTVYRNLLQLEESKQITSILGPQQLRFYEAYAEPHHHFICEKCSQIFDLTEPSPKTCFSCISKTLPHQIDSVITTLTGTCNACKQE